MLPGESRAVSFAPDGSKEVIQNSPPVRVDWQSHLEVLPLASWIGESDGGEIFVNKACRELLGVSDLTPAIYRSWENFVHPDDRSDYVKAWDLFITGFAARFRETVRWIRPDNGKTVKLAVRAQKLGCDRFQGWIRSARLEQALLKLEELAHVRTK